MDPETVSDRSDAVSAAWAARKALVSLDAGDTLNLELDLVQLDFDAYCQGVFTADELAAIRDETEAVAA